MCGGVTDQRGGCEGLMNCGDNSIIELHAFALKNGAKLIVGLPTAKWFGGWKDKYNYIYI